jgi:uncharacterized protein (TIGR03382 family)
VRRTLALVIIISLINVALTGDVFAFQIESPITYGCHEKITVEARRAAGYPDTTLAPKPSEDQRRAANDLTFTLPADEGDVWTMTLLIGLRSNDVKDLAILDPAGLVSIHDDPEDQPAHCIRRIEDNGPEGDATAVAACRAFIVGELAEGRFFADEIDTTSEELVPLYLTFRLQVKVHLPRFAYRLGRALHALEDGYAHTLRNPTTGAVRHVTNWIDFSTNKEYSVARDGLEHLSTIDDCLRNTDVERYHVDYAREAVTDLLNALRDPSGDGEARRARAEAALDRAFVLEPGCTHENRYCMAPELDELSPGCSSSPGAGIGVVLALVALLLLRRHRNPGTGDPGSAGDRARAERAQRVHDASARRRLAEHRREYRAVGRRHRPYGACVLVGLLVGPGVASADEVPILRDRNRSDPSHQEGALPDSPPDLPSELPQTVEAERLPPVPEVSAIKPPGSTRWHVDFRFGAALDHAAFAFTGGLGVDYKRWTLGLAVEWNPWFSLDTSTARGGAVNIYGTLARRWYDDERFTLYSRAELGTSTILFDLVGVDKYQTGVYLGGSLLGVAIKRSHGLRMTLDPSHFAMPIPKPTGLPFYWRQYRIAIGLEFALE